MRSSLLLRSAGFALFSASALLSTDTVFAQRAPHQSAAPAEHEQVSLLYKTTAGLTLNYVEQGDPAGPVLVLLHGAGDSWHSYDRVYPLLPSRYHVFAITLRGHGLSDHPAEGFTSADFAGDISDFLQKKDLHHVTLVGHSLGSFVAQKVAETDGQHRLDKLVLIGSSPGLGRRPSNGDEPINMFSSLKDPIPYTFARDFQASTIYYPVPARYFELWVAEAQRVPAATWHGLGQGHTGSLDDIRKITIPTLVLWGEKDSIFHRADEDLLMKTLPHATFTAYPETGHALHWERPERFAKELIAFVDGRAASSR